MTSKRDNETFLEYKQRTLDPVSPSFCAAKWLNATIWLGSGATTSCHLPPAHKIDAEEIKANPSAIHNSQHKKKMRKLMLEGHRPQECDYCWKIEDVGRDNISDRTFKTAQFSEEGIKALPTLPWDHDIHLETLEIAFNRACNFACSYCNAGFSTTWAKDINSHGAYQNMVSDGAGAYQHNGSWAEPYGKLNVGNPYIEAFWKWWPEMSKGLKQLRITGGEPLMSPDVWKLFDYFERNGTNGMQFAINSNLGGKDELIERLIDKSHAVEHFELFTSNEAMGIQAEYIRDGMDFDHWAENVERVLTHGNITLFNVMMTINNLCLFSLVDFLDLMLVWKERFGAQKVIWSANILRFPSFMSPLVLPDHLKVERHAALVSWMEANRENPLVGSFEMESLQRLADYIEVVSTPHHKADEMEKLMRDFKSFHRQYDERRRKSLSEAFPELAEWIATIPDTDLGVKQELIDGNAAN